MYQKKASVFMSTPFLTVLLCLLPLARGLGQSSFRKSVHTAAVVSTLASLSSASSVTASTAKPTTAVQSSSSQPSCSISGKTCNLPKFRDCRFILVMCLVAVAIVLYPIGRFLAKQWSFRRERIFGAMAGDAAVYYYLQFRQGSKVIADHPVEASQAPFEKEDQDAYLTQFKRDFYLWYGKRYYIAPTLMLAVLTFSSAWWAVGVLNGWSLSTPSDSYRMLVAAALAGAFMWVVSDELDRLRRRDFTTNDVYYYVFRILIAIPFAWALSKTQISDSGGALTIPVTIPIAFFLGAFPTTTLFTLARRFVSQTLKLGDDKESGDLELEKLQSVVKPNAERFKAEDISTITALAYADPIDLTIRTNFDLNYVVDCVSQALMWIYFGDDCKSLFQFSLRGAQEIAALVLWSHDKTNADHYTNANQAIVDAAGTLKIKMNELAFRATLDQIAEDPYTIFLVNMWQ